MCRMQGPRSVIVDAESAGGRTRRLVQSTESIGIFVAHFVGTTHGAGRNRAGRSPVLIADRRRSKSLRLVVITDSVSIIAAGGIIIAKSITDLAADGII